MHFYEASIITTKDGLHCQVYSNEHPKDSIIVKPKYIPTDKIESDSLSFRFISGKKMNRLNLWTDEKALKKYINEFKKNYTPYILDSPIHKGDYLFFSIPIQNIERIYFPKRGLNELMNMPINALDKHLKKVHIFVDFLLGSGLKLNNLGITYSTLMGHYLSDISDINIVVYGKKNFWKLMKYLEKIKHPMLRWKTDEEWISFYKKRKRYKIFNQEKFLQCMKRKKSEGFFDNTLFVIFGAENEDSVWSKWGSEKYIQMGNALVECTIENDFDSVVRPGCYHVTNSKIIEGNFNVPIKQIVFYSRDYCMLAKTNEKVRASGKLEKVLPTNGEVYYRLVVGYFDTYINGRRGKEFIKTI